MEASEGYLSDMVIFLCQYQEDEHSSVDLRSYKIWWGHMAVSLTLS